MFRRAQLEINGGCGGSEVENVINEVAIRAMAKAVYSPENIGHFGLGFKYYTHFTSPIRRYPDLIVHRMLLEYEHGMSLERRNFYSERLPFITKQSSDRERVAMEAERESVKVMQVEYMKRHLGDEFHGVISGVTNFGLFVKINELLTEGMIRMRDLDDDYYIFDEKNYAIVGQQQKSIDPGDALLCVMRVCSEPHYLQLQTFVKRKHINVCCVDFLDGVDWFNV